MAHTEYNYGALAGTDMECQNFIVDAALTFHACLHAYYRFIITLLPSDDNATRH